MKIYWLFLLLATIICFWNESSARITWNGTRYQRKAYWSQAIIFFAVVIFFCGLRSGIADTGTYIQMFKGYPSSISGMNLKSVNKDKGFFVISVLFKQFISNDFHGWLFLITLISGVALMIGLMRYSEYFGLSCYLLIASTMFTYFVNGMRQFIVVTIFFCATYMILEGKWTQYVILILLLSTIHGSALILLLVYFLRNVKPWGAKMRTVIFFSLIAGVCFDKLFPLFGNILAETQYKGYVDYISSQGKGSSIIRMVIAMIPCVIAYMARYAIEDENNKLINFSINMSVINFCLYIIATFSSGMVVGRLTTYFDIYNLILLPWLMHHAFTERSRKMVILLCMAFYLVFFYFQMVLTWGLVYESDILHLYL